MPYAGAVFGQLGRFVVASMVALVFAASMAPRANAQFQFTWTGGNISGQSVVVSILFNATETGLGTGIYDITGLISGSIDDLDDAGSGENLDATVSGFTTDTYQALTPRNQFFFPAGVVGASGHYANVDVGNSLIGGFRIETDLATNPDFIFFADPVQDLVYRTPSGNVGTTLITTFDGTHSITQVPGPIAGAGMLSWLAVMVMGLAWRRQWLLAKARTWLAARWLRDAQVA